MTFLYLLHRDLPEHLSRQAYAKLQLVREFGTNVLRRDQFSHLQHPGGKYDDDARLTCHYCRHGFRHEYVPSAMKRCRLGRDSKASLKSLSCVRLKYTANRASSSLEL
jgi:hypothetical protein